MKVDAFDTSSNNIGSLLRILDTVGTNASEEHAASIFRAEIA